jgi:hypothetical protein
MEPDPDAVRRHSQRVLSMVAELHKLGYQRLRIAPGMSPSGAYWRCLITPVTNILTSHGAQAGSADPLEGVGCHQARARDCKH